MGRIDYRQTHGTPVLSISSFVGPPSVNTAIGDLTSLSILGDEKSSNRRQNTCLLRCRFPWVTAVLYNKKPLRRFYPTRARSLPNIVPNIYLSSPPVRVSLSTFRIGLICAKLEGARNAKSDVLIFLDSHCEVNRDWLRPLLQRIKESNSSVLTPVIDIILLKTFDYMPSIQVVGEFQTLGLCFAVRTQFWSHDVVVLHFVNLTFIVYGITKCIICVVLCLTAFLNMLYTKSFCASLKVTVVYPLEVQLIYLVVAVIKSSEMISIVSKTCLNRNK